MSFWLNLNATNEISFGSIVLGKRQKSQIRLSENLKLQIKLKVSAWLESAEAKCENMFLAWFEEPLKEISTSVCVDVIKLQSWNGLSALSVYLASIIFYL